MHDTDVIVNKLSKIIQNNSGRRSQVGWSQFHKRVLSEQAARASRFFQISTEWELGNPMQQFLNSTKA